MAQPNPPRPKSKWDRGLSRQTSQRITRNLESVQEERFARFYAPSNKKLGSTSDNKSGKPLSRQESQKKFLIKRPSKLDVEFDKHRKSVLGDDKRVNATVLKILEIAAAKRARGEVNVNEDSKIKRQLSLEQREKQFGEKLLLSDAFKAVGYSVHEEGRTQHHHRVLEDQSYVPITEGSNLGDMKALKHGIDQVDLPSRAVQRLGARIWQKELEKELKKRSMTTMELHISDFAMQEEKKKGYRSRTNFGLQRLRRVWTKRVRDGKFKNITAECIQREIREQEQEQRLRMKLAQFKSD